jgi:hypothetical protein
VGFSVAVRLHAALNLLLTRVCDDGLAGNSATTIDRGGFLKRAMGFEPTTSALGKHKPASPKPQKSPGVSGI